jgi:hypothetical protein
MSALVWTIRWTERRPSFGSDEMCRTTAVLPVPWTAQVDQQDGPHWLAVVVVVAPWWAQWRHVVDPQVRAYIRWKRSYNRDLFRLYRMFDDPPDWVFGEVDRRWLPSEPPFPACWEQA